MNLVFFATPSDFLPLLTGCLAIPGTRLFEAYSGLNETIRTFSSADAACQALSLGHDPHGSGSAGFFALWASEVMPPPSVQRVELSSKKFPQGTWRYTIAGCGLFYFQTGGLCGQEVIASRITAFTERGARAKCLVAPGPDEVAWSAHAHVGKLLTRLVRTQLAVTRAGMYSIMTGALQAHGGGSRLVLRHGGPQVRIGST